MMRAATIAIHEYFSTKTELKVFTEEVGDTSAVVMGFRLKGSTNGYTIRFISRDDGNDVAVRVFGLVAADEEKADRVLRAVNQLNRRFRFTKFVMGDDNRVHVEYDFGVSTPDLIEGVKEIIARFVKIIEEAYPELMRAMWS